jgi:uncharacterized membrane protein YdfJ with MMPL/SSD domain
MRSYLLDTETRRPLLIAFSLISNAVFALGILLLLLWNLETVPTILIIGYILFVLIMFIIGIYYVVEWIRRHRSHND